MFERLKRKIRLIKIKKMIEDIRQDNMEYREIIRDAKDLVDGYIDSTVKVLQQLQLANNSLKEVFNRDE